MAIEFNLFEEYPSGVDSWRRAYWSQKNQQNDKVTRWLKNTNSATVEVVLQKEDSAQDRVKQFYDAQRDLARNGLPPQTKEGAYNIGGATVEISEMQLRNMSEFSDQAFKTGQSLSQIQIKSNKIYFTKCGHYDSVKAGATSFDKEGFRDSAETTKDDYCFACKCSIASELNPKSDFISFKKTNPDEMVNHPSTAYNELPDKNSIYPFPFGSKIPTTPNMTPTDSLPEGTLANNPLQEGFRDMQKNNTVDWVGNQYLPSGTQDGKPHVKPPQFQLSSAADADLGCLMAMIPDGTAAQFTDFAKQKIDQNSLHEKGLEDEPHITVLYGFSNGFDASKLTNMLAGSGPISFTLGEVERFECPNYDVLHFKVNSPDLEMINAKIAREFAHNIEDSNYKYNPHLTLGYVQKGTNQHLDGQTIPKQHFIVGKLMYSGPHKTNKHMISIAWDGIKMDDGGFQDGVGTKNSGKPFGTNLGEILQEFLVKQSEQKKKDKKDIEAQLKKPFGHNK